MEIGAGGGTAASLVCQRLTPGRGTITAIDRSTTAAKRTAARNATYVEDGRAVVLATPFTASGLADPPDGAFTKIFSINVSLFCGQPGEEMALIRRLLAPGGAMFACWGRGPIPGRSYEVAKRAVARFTAAGFATTLISEHGLQCVTARP